MSKKKNTSAKPATHQIPNLGEQQARVATPADETLANISYNDFQHVLVIGLQSDDTLRITTSFNTFESIHAALNRAQLEITVAHNRVVNEALKAKQETIEAE